MEDETRERLHRFEVALGSAIFRHQVAHDRDDDEDETGEDGAYETGFDNGLRYARAMLAQAMKGPV